MNFTLKRNEAREDGIFGELLDSNNTAIAVTLEHSYDSGLGDGSYAPKLLPGQYKCVRGKHSLHTIPVPFDTFEVTGVAGHQGILFHPGNFNHDSDGCILLGRNIVPTLDGGGNMITSSRNTFNKFMNIQKDVQEFTLTVS